MADEPQNVNNVLKSKKKYKYRVKYQSELGNAKKGHGFAEYRKRRVLNQYKKLHRNNRNNKKFLNRQRDDQNKKLNKLETAKEEFEKEIIEKERLKKEALHVKQKKEDEIKLRQAKRRETHKKLTTRTKRGQPIMANYVECLLEKIQNT